MADGKKRTMVLAILDGWGYSDRKVGNPIKQANTPTLNQITYEYPLTLLQASGLAVGMAWGECGNSEVGHLNLGAGRIVEQYYSRINRSIKDQTFYTNPALLGAFNYAKEKNSSVHLVGLLTTGTVHAAFNHLLALLYMASQFNPMTTYLHLYLDGRDSGLQEGADMILKLNDEIAKIGAGRIATLIGRDFAMDRDNNWDKTRKATELITKATGEKSDDFLATIQNYYQQGINDSGMPAIVSSQSGFTGLQNNDALIFFNFREDSMRQTLASFADPKFSLFPRKEISGLNIATMTLYLDGLDVSVAIPPPMIKNGLAEVLSANSLKQMHIAETDKYAHVTYFFNGLQNAAYPGETDIFVESVKNLEAQPEMSSAEIATKVTEALELNVYDFIVLNFANADLLAHTGNYEATVRGVEAVDAALQRIISVVLKNNFLMVITADHGNAESLIYHKSGEAETKHDDSPVQFILIGSEYRTSKDQSRIDRELSQINGILPDVAPTILELMKIEVPPEMSGQSLMTTLLAK
ncbi:MAG: 2,3-bisphosphoglycerate-independent phosphoglycerate mutase [Minisyncoccia bacterium]